MDQSTKYKQKEPVLPGNAVVEKPSYTRGEALAEEHWKYIRNLFHASAVKMDPGELERIEFHYKTAMIHGYKHGWNDREWAIKG